MVETEVLIAGKLSIFNINRAVSLPQLLLSISIMLYEPRSAYFLVADTGVVVQPELLPSPQTHLNFRGLGVPHQREIDLLSKRNGLAVSQLSGFCAEMIAESLSPACMGDQVVVELPQLFVAFSVTMPLHSCLR